MTKKLSKNPNFNLKKPQFRQKIALNVDDIITSCYYDCRQTEMRPAACTIQDQQSIKVRNVNQRRNSQTIALLFQFHTIFLRVFLVNIPWLIIISHSNRHCTFPIKSIVNFWIQHTQKNGSLQSVFFFSLIFQFFLVVTTY